MSTTGADAYRDTAIVSADPVSLTTMLYDGALRALKRARLHYEAGNRQRFMDEAERAQLILGELLASLDMEAGGEIAANLSGIYAYCIRQVIEATLGDVDKIDDVERHISRIAAAWKEATAGIDIDELLQQPRREGAA
ncbi:MAG: flagellar export chaperone FliS [Dehalococcoidia bacterium]